MCAADKEVFSSFAHAQISITNEIYQYLGEPQTFLFCPTGKKIKIPDSTVKYLCWFSILVKVVYCSTADYIFSFLSLFSAHVAKWMFLPILQDERSVSWQQSRKEPPLLCLQRCNGHCVVCGFTSTPSGSRCLQCLESQRRKEDLKGFLKAFSPPPLHSIFQVSWNKGWINLIRQWVVQEMYQVWELEQITVFLLFPSHI